MIGMKRLDNLQFCVESVIRDGIPGDLIETGIWRGDRYGADANDRHHEIDLLAVGLEEVKSNFRRYNLLDDRVRFLKGWFKDTLPTAPIGALAVIRLDGDMYESTIQAMDALYAKLSVGGFLIVDDYFWKPCAQAIHDFRDANGIREPIIDIDGRGAYWQRTA